MWQNYRYIIEFPLWQAADAFGFTVTSPVRYIYDVVASIVVLGFLTGAVKAALRYAGKFRPSKTMSDREEYEALVAARVLAAREGDESKVTMGLAELKRTNHHEAVGDIYAEMGRHTDAAKWYAKGGFNRKAAYQYNRAGKKMKAARMLIQEGDFEGAARVYEEKRKYVRAAETFRRAGMLADAARAYVWAKRLEEAARTYLEYFAAAREPLETQLVAAEECLRMLESSAGRAKVTGQLRTDLQKVLAGRFEAAKMHEVAAQLYISAGDPGRAGEVFVLVGQLEQAAECFRSAGRTAEASRITGRFHESQGRWREAAAAYASSGDLLRAGECYLKASDVVRAAECFERANEFYRAGVSYARAARYADAIRVLQKIRENDPLFDQSRGLLGRCFYELHDYAHCAATLDNHLTGKRVESGNLDYWYMLALAYEQMGELTKSRDILYKIRSVEVGFRDVSERLSNISSRISMRASAGTAATNLAAGSSGTEATLVMQNVENALDGRYHLERELGRGGMGIVFLARDTQLDRAVALKFLGSLVDSSEEFRQRFIREARAAARINHPNIISIYDISASSGKAYIAMEFVEGPSLARYIDERGPLAPREAVNLVGQACAALAAIHEAGVVHRDIKPDNILIAKGNLVKLTDFGLAKAQDVRLTRTGTVMGTPSYMAPEQVLGKAADPRSDIYSLGLVLHETLTGKVVFSDGDVLERQLTEMPSPPSATAQDVPPALDAVVMKCVAKKPDERYASARELLADLRKALA